MLAHAFQVAREAGMQRDTLRELQAHLPWEERPWIWARIMRELRVDGFPIRVAQRYSVGEIGALGMVAHVAPDLRSAVQRLIGHQHVLTGKPLARMIDVDSSTTILEVLPVEGNDLGGRCRREEMVASGLKLLRDISRVEIRPRRVCFAHPAPADLREHEAFFGCEIRFDAGYDGLEFDREALALPLPGADADLSHYLLEQLHELAGDPPAEGSPVEDRLSQVIACRIGKRTLAMSAVAHELGMSARTLRRRLLERRTSYHELLDRVRCDLADELLDDPARKLSEIALLLGFSDASAFHRAYVRWTRETPASRRRRPLAP